MSLPKGGGKGDRMEICRKWAMPNSETFSIKPIKDLLKQEVVSGIWLDPFARNSDLSNLFVKVITNDLNPTCKTDYHLDAIDFLKQFTNGFADGVLYDPPYSPRQIMECYQGIGIETYNTKMDFYSKIKDEVARVCKIGGKVIGFGWNSMGMSISRGFEIVKILLVPHGGAKNDTIVTVERKIRERIKINE
jgi:hypothetical protein